MREAARRNPDKFSMGLDQAVRNAFDYYKSAGSWTRALKVMQDASSRNPGKFSTVLNQAVRDAFDYYKASGRWSEALKTVQEAANKNPRVFGPLLKQASLLVAKPGPGIREIRRPPVASKSSRVNQT